MNKSVVDFTAIGFKALQRAILETERRFCGNQSEELNHKNVTLNDREKMAMLLDLRTLPCSNVEKEVRKQAVDLLQEAYVEFGFNCVSYDRQQTAKAAAKAAAHVASVVAEKKGSASPQAKSSQARLLHVANESMNAVEKTSFDPLGAWSDDEDLDVGEEDTDVDICEEKVKELLNQEFPVKFRAWRNKPAAVDWNTVDDKVTLRDPSAPDMFDLMGMDISSLYKGLDEGGIQYGYLPAMASCSKGQLGALNAESFCERCLSCANMVVTEGNTLLLDDEVRMLVILRMNVDFMEFMREHYGHVVGNQPWKMTVVD